MSFSRSESHFNWNILVSIFNTHFQNNSLAIKHWMFQKSPAVDVKRERERSMNCPQLETHQASATNLSRWKIKVEGQTRKH